jgi:hemoglobin
MDELGLIYGELGEEKLRAMVAAFYRRVATDDLLGPMYPPEDFEGAERRLAGFLIFRFGGPQTYIAERGHPRLKMRHFPFVINGAARDRWLALMNAAMEETEIPEPFKSSLGSFFTVVAHNMQNSTDG